MKPDAYGRFPQTPLSEAFNNEISRLVAGGHISAAMRLAMMRDEATQVFLAGGQLRGQ